MRFRIDVRGLQYVAMHVVESGVHGPFKMDVTHNVITFFGYSEGTMHIYRLKICGSMDGSAIIDADAFLRILLDSPADGYLNVYCGEDDAEEGFVVFCDDDRLFYESAEIQTREVLSRDGWAISEEEINAMALPTSRRISV